MAGRLFTRWQRRLVQMRIAEIERAKHRAITKMTIERLVAEERLRYLLRGRSR